MQIREFHQVQLRGSRFFAPNPSQLQGTGQGRERGKGGSREEKREEYNKNVQPIIDSKIDVQQLNDSNKHVQPLNHSILHVQPFNKSNVYVQSLNHSNIHVQPFNKSNIYVKSISDEKYTYEPRLRSSAIYYQCHLLLEYGGAGWLGHIVTSLLQLWIKA